MAAAWTTAAAARAARSALQAAPEGVRVRVTDGVRVRIRIRVRVRVRVRGLHLVPLLVVFLVLREPRRRGFRVRVRVRVRPRREGWQLLRRWRRERRVAFGAVELHERAWLGLGLELGLGQGLGLK